MRTYHSFTLQKNKESRKIGFLFGKNSATVCIPYIIPYFNLKKNVLRPENWKNFKNFWEMMGY